MPARITLTPKQKAALLLSSKIQLREWRHETHGSHINSTVLAVLRQHGLVGFRREGLSAKRWEATDKGLQWLAGDAQPATVKQEPEALSEHIASRLPKGYMS